MNHQQSESHQTTSSSQVRDGENQRSEKRVFSRTYVFYSSGKEDYVARLTQATGMQYLAIKTGMTTHICNVDVPPQKSIIINISKPGSYRIMDRDESTYFIISEKSIEFKTTRWAKLLFETVEVHTRFGSVLIGSEEIKQEFKVGRAVGSVPPYTEEEESLGTKDLRIPGVTFYDPEGFADERAKMKEERDVRIEVTAKALQNSGASRAQGRMYSLPHDKVSSLNNAKFSSYNEDVAFRRESIDLDRQEKLHRERGAVIRTTHQQMTKSGRLSSSASWNEESFENEADRLINSLEQLNTGTKPKQQRPILQRIQSSTSEITHEQKETQPQNGVHKKERPVITQRDIEANIDEAIGLLHETQELIDVLSGKIVVVPETSGEYEKPLGFIDIPEMVLPTFAVDRKNASFELDGYHKSRSVRVVASGESIFMLPEASR
uniref:Non-structural protein NS2 n=1 Tax=Mudumu virus TaxID=2841875 RepID=A0A8E8V141_9REOV|nr:viral inclusion body protein [Mudumu virus]